MRSPSKKPVRLISSTRPSIMTEVSRIFGQAALIAGETAAAPVHNFFPIRKPESMRAAFDAKLAERPASPAGYFRCAYRSLADTYGRAVRAMERSTGVVCRKLYIVGGGAKNQFLNRLTEAATGKQVTALPMEATAVGNIKVQMAADEQREEAER